MSQDFKIRYERAAAELLTVQDENKQLRAKVAELESKERYSLYRNELQRSVNEGVILDVEEEMKHVQTMRMDRDQFNAHHERIKTHYQRRPPSELIPTSAPQDPGSPNGDRGTPAATEGAADADIDRVAAARTVQKCVYARNQKQVVDYDTTFIAERQKVFEHHKKTGELLSETPEETAAV